MKVILNYKSFYDAFKLGMVDDGFTPVAKVLFYPLFSAHTILDENGEPYEVDAQNASRWGNGQIPIQKEIQDAAGTNEALTKMITYFKDKVVPIELSEALMDEMLEAMVGLVNDCDLSDSKKKQFLKYYEKGEVGEFLARVFQRALLGKNKVTSSRKKISASENNVDSANEFNALVRGKLKKPKTTVPKKIQAHELGYVSQLYRAYGQTKSVSVNKPEDLVPLDLSEHFEMQRKHYYLAETIHRKLRDSIKKDEDDCFDILKDEIETGIYKASHTQYASPVERIDAVTERASDVIISPNTEQIMYNWIGPGEKMGVCHMLVNDERLEWVESDERELI